MVNITRRQSSNALAIAAVSGLLAWGAAGVALAQSAPEAPKRGGTFVMALGANPEHLNISISSSVIVSLPAQAVTEGLIRINSKFQPEPVLATGWQVSPDGKRITFNLRQGVTWHDGKPFTAADVKYSLEKLTPLHARSASVFKNVLSVESQGEHTVVVTLKEPFGPFIDLLTADNVGIQPSHLYAGSEPLKNPANLRPVGTGPFKFDSWQTGQRLTFVRNPDYWDKGKPYLDRFVFRVIPDSNTRALALEAGDIDYIPSYDLSSNDAIRLKKTKGIVVATGRGMPRVLLLFFNNKKKPFDDARVRKALLQGLDRQIMLSSAYNDLGGLGTSSIPAGLSWANSPEVNYMKMYAFDTDRANRELDQAGLARGPDGIRFSARFTYDPAQPGYTDVAEIVRSNWQKLGVRVALEARERSVWLNMVYTAKDYDTSIAWYATNGDPALGIDRAYRCEDVRPAAFTNASQYCNPALDDLLRKGATAMRKEDRAQFYRQAQAIVARDLPTAVLLDSGYADAMRDNFGNLPAFFESPSDTHMRYAELFRKR
ncbi:MAG: ABC transporter substrate-binding protein [Betaproteobacteria bacterium]|nr:ABC transporter substrate-binding protein [Betaproteobacteria bacterium]